MGDTGVMVEIRQDPSMEDILASIKRIIAEDGTDVAPARMRNGAAPAATADDVLELTEQLPSADQPAIDPPPTPRAETEMKPESNIVSMDAALASRQSLSALSALLVKPAVGEDNTLEGLVREMLRPMLKEWLDAKLPEIVEAIVAKEIKRITGDGL